VNPKGAVEERFASVEEELLDIHSLPAVNHQKEFAARTITPNDEAAVRDGALAMAWTVLDLATGHRWDELGSSG
jgi:hypothetical protein